MKNKSKNYEKLLERLHNWSNIGKITKFKEKKIKGKKVELGTIVDEVSQIQHNDPEYKHFIQKIEYKEQMFKGLKYSGTGYRMCYYTIDAKETKIAFGQFACHMTEKDFTELMNKAKDKGFF